MDTSAPIVASFLIAVLFTAGIGMYPAWAKIYKWKDDNGKTHFTDSPSKIPPQYRNQTGDGTPHKKTPASLNKPKSSFSTSKQTKASRIEKENVTVKYTYYDIRGSKANDLRKQMDALGPLSAKDEMHYDGRTGWSISWKSRSQNNGKECLKFTIILRMQINYTMPKWVNYNKAPVSLRRHWDKYYNALDLHEQGHGNHGVMALEEIERSVPKIQKGKSCQQLKQAFKGDVHIIIDKYNQIDVKYDEETRHGFTQGAVFP